MGTATFILLILLTIVTTRDNDLKIKLVAADKTIIILSIIVPVISIFFGPFSPGYMFEGAMAVVVTVLLFVSWFYRNHVAIEKIPTNN